MRAIDLISKKRDNGALSEEEIRFLVHGYAREEIPDSQMAALLMAVVWRGMNAEETQALTAAMISSGATLDFSHLGRKVVDKHSTGGVGDKTSLVLLPMLAAIGMPVAKMSGRALGFTGGTLDKLESFTNFRVALTKEEFTANLMEHGLVIAAQTADLVPADGRIYALRDMTATVGSIPLIASSVMSKKLAAGAGAIVLDVKMGRGSFMANMAQAKALASAMLKIGQKAGRSVAAVISDMSQPLGFAVGNALEVKESVQTLQGKGPDDLEELCLTLGTHLALVAGSEKNAEEARSRLAASLENGAALKKLADLVAAQGGRREEVYDPSLLPAAPVVVTLQAGREGFVTGVDPRAIALAAAQLGAGRSRKGDPIDHSVGLVLRAKVGDFLSPGSELVDVHARTREDVHAVQAQVVEAFAFGAERVQCPPLIHDVIV